MTETIKSTVSFVAGETDSIVGTFDYLFVLAIGFIVLAGICVLLFMFFKYNKKAEFYCNCRHSKKHGQTEAKKICILCVLSMFVIAISAFFALIWYLSALAGCLEDNDINSNNVLHISNIVGVVDANSQDVSFNSAKITNKGNHDYIIDTITIKKCEGINDSCCLWDLYSEDKQFFNGSANVIDDQKMLYQQLLFLQMVLLK